MTAATVVCEFVGEPADHPGYHAGWPCPYDVIPALAAGQPDPRDLVAEWRVDISTILKPDGSAPLTLNRMPPNVFALGKARDVIKARVRNAVRDVGVPDLERVHVELHYRPKTNAHRDADNLVATLKPAIDAMWQADPASDWAGILAGDDPRYVTWSQPRIHPAVKGQSPALWLILRSYG